MQLTSCSVLCTRLSADPMMSLDFIDKNKAEITPTVAVYKRLMNGPYIPKKAARMPALSDPNFLRFRDQLASVAERIRSTVAVSDINAATCFYGKGWFHEGFLHFRFHRGVPGGQLADPGEPLWDEIWPKKPRNEFPEEIKLSTRDLPGFEVNLEPRLSSEYLEFLRPKAGWKSEAQVEFYRVCFCFRHSPDLELKEFASIRLLCWLHPVNLQQHLLHRLELAAMNNYLCEFERLQTLTDPHIAWLLSVSERSQLFFLAVEAGNWSVADWLMSGPEGCGVDTLDAWGDTELARLCHLGGEPEAMAGLLARGADKRRRDAEGSSPLHRLAAALRHFDDTEAYVLPALRALVGNSSRTELMDWLAEENSAGEKPMALLSCDPALDWILSRLLMEPQGDGCRANADKSSLASQVLSLLVCSTGYSLIHSFAAYGQLDSAEQAVNKWLGASAWLQLLTESKISHQKLQQHQQHQQHLQHLQHQQVDRRGLHGYSAIHAAFQEGSWLNVNYLTRCQGQTAPPPESAVDLAIREGHLATFEKFQVFVSRAMPRPDVGEALGVLDRVEDCLAGVAPVAGSLAVPAVDIRLHNSVAQSIIGRLRDPLLMALKSAFDHDSAESLRALVRSRGAKFSCWALQSSCQEVWLLARLEDTLTPSGSLVTTTRQSMPLVSRSRPEEIGDGFLGLLGLALRWGRWRLAGQLLRARQFDLLPACLAVMLCLKRWRRRQRQSGRPRGLLVQDGSPLSCSIDGVDAPADKTQQPFELMEDLYKLAKRIFCSAMLRLYQGAVTDAKLGLVLNYLGGRFHHTHQLGHQQLQIQQRGPLFDSGDGTGATSSIFDMMMLTEEPDLLALPCATDYVDRLMSCPRSFCCHTCPGGAGDGHDGAVWAQKPPLRLLANWWPDEATRVSRLLPRGWTPMSNMAITFAFNLLFLCVLGYYVHQIGSQEGKATVLMGLKVFLLVGAISYAIQEIRDLLATRDAGNRYACGNLCNRLEGYAAFNWNMLDLTAVSLLLFALIAVFVLDCTDGSGDGLWYYAVRQILALSFALYCLRMLSTLGYYERLGLYISMIRTSFVADVVPFLVVNVFFLVSFGFLIVSLLFPGGRTYAGGQSYTSSKLNISSELSYDAYIAEMFQRPMLAHFGEFSADFLRGCLKQSGSDASECPHPLGNQLYSRFLLFVYLLIVSVLFINVLIAKLSLTVSREDERARVIWRQFRAKLLVEFSGISAPLPVLALEGCLAIVRMLRGVLRCYGNRCCTSTSDKTAASAATSTDTLENRAERGETDSSSKTAMKQAAANLTSYWWLSSDIAQTPKDYQEFLWLQAMQFRKLRLTFGQHNKQ